METDTGSPIGVQAKGQEPDTSPNGGIQVAYDEGKAVSLSYPNAFTHYSGNEYRAGNFFMQHMSNVMTVSIEGSSPVELSKKSERQQKETMGPSNDKTSPSPQTGGDKTETVVIKYA